MNISSFCLPTDGIFRKMSMKSDSLEVIHEGWLTKSPPTKRIWRARWRRRWFVLKHSGELPGQYFLYYYTDRNCRKLKGQIDLDQCEQVDAGLRFEHRKQKYQYMFDVRTPKRTYYLAAETEADMNKWVECVCHVCGLKADNDCEFDIYDGCGGGSSVVDESSQNNPESPPVSPTSTASGPYIPISECISGKPLSSPEGLNTFLALQQQQQQGKKINGDDFYDAPRKLQPPDLELRASGSTTPPMQSPATDAESVFTDDEWVNPHPKPAVNWETFPRPSDSSIEGDQPNRTTVSAAIRYAKVADVEGMPVPPRPPKPPHLSSIDNSDQPQYTNLENNDSSLEVGSTIALGISDDMYDFPRSHNVTEDITNSSNGKSATVNPVPSRHCYTNAAPSKVNGTVFRYDFEPNQSEPQIVVQQHVTEPPSPASTSEGDSTIVVYSNIPSPSPSQHTLNSVSGGISGPPAVNRELKPGRKTSDSAASNEPSPIPVVVPGQPPPSVDRALKPTPAVRKKLPENFEDGLSAPGVLKLCPPPIGRMGAVTRGDYSSQSLKKTRAAPSPTLPNFPLRRHSDTSEPDLRMTKDSDSESYHSPYGRLLSGSTFSYGSKRWDEIQYLDLDLDSTENTTPTTPPASNHVAVTPNPTVYKTVDFVKTEALVKLTRQIRAEEAEKKQQDVM